MTKIPESIKFDTCNWKYDSWKNIVYSENVEHHLAEYSKHYNIVEIDQWFWSLFVAKTVLPKPDVLEEYVRSVLKEFRFSIKVPNSITLTHHYTKNKNMALLENSHFLSNDLLKYFLRKILPNKTNQYD